MQLRPEDWQALSVSERIELVRIELSSEIWDSVARDVEALPMEDAQRLLVHERLEIYRADPSRALRWEELRETLRRSL